MACPGEPVLFWITSLTSPIVASELYRKRWKIETCFKCLKTNGSNLQQTTTKQPAKIALLLAVVVFAYVLCLLEGFRQRAQIRLKRYRSGSSGPAQSFFKRGIQFIASGLVDFLVFLRLVQRWLEAGPKEKWSFVQ
ncbi:transposase [Fibrella forsythiae]|uniref:transposase n=1 Tax=Fibrella forsythiae TaxID=2817061 RepID=UPI00286E3A16|nr:transposase [Fibrella forsythiae]